MKVLLICHKLAVTNGWGRYTVDLKNGLEKEGFEVVTTEELLKEKSSHLSDPQIYLLQPISWRMPFKFIKDVWNVRRLIKTENPEIIHITVEPYVLLLPFLNIKNRAVFMTAHGTYSYIPNVVRPIFRFIYNPWVAYSFSLLNSIVAVSKYTRNYILNNIKVGQKTVVINNFINIATDTEHIPHLFKKIFVTVGMVKRRKGILEALKALHQFKNKYRIPFEYRIIGSYREDDAYYIELQNYIRDYDLTDSVRFLGKVSDEELKENYKVADLFIMLSIKDNFSFEGFGLVYLEANSYGVPTMGSIDSAADDSINNGISGVLIDPYCDAAISEKIYSITMDNIISPKNCRAWADIHGEKNTTLRYVNLYKKFLKF